MDLYKSTNIVKATSYDFNASCVNLRDRKNTSKMLSRYSRRKLKRKLESSYRLDKDYFTT